MTARFPYANLPDLTGAKCLDPSHDRTDWYPGIGGGASAAASRALAACRACPVARRCLTDALDYERRAGTSWGIWGGTTPEQRATLLKGRREAVSS